MCVQRAALGPLYPASRPVAALQRSLQGRGSVKTSSVFLPQKLRTPPQELLLSRHLVLVAVEAAVVFPLLLHPQEAPILQHTSLESPSLAPLPAPIMVGGLRSVGGHFFRDAWS